MTTTVQRISLALAAVSLAVGVGVYAAAQDQNTNQPRRPFMGLYRQGGPGGPGGFGRGGPIGFLPRLGRAIQLTDSQRDQISAIAATHKDEWKALADRARTAHGALMDAVAADTVDESLIRQKSAEVAAVDADMAVARARVHAEVAQVLTADQKAKLKELRAQGKPRSGQF